MLVIFLTPIKLILAQQSDCLSPNVYTSDGRCIKPMNPYVLLAPLPCPDNDVNCTAENGKSVLNSFKFNPNINTLGAYLNLIIKIIIGLSAVLAVVMIVIGGMEDMTSELVSSKEAGKDRIRDAIFGLVLALGAYTLLFTINPDLLSTNINIPDATVRVPLTLDEANFARTEKTVATVGTKYVIGLASPGVSDFVKKDQPLSVIVVDTATQRASFCQSTGCVFVPINIGFNGVSEAGQAQANDGKTPKGTTTISGDVRLGNAAGDAVVSGSGYNLGAAFINAGATINGADRGIGFHGSYNNVLGTTNGCIRMKNADLIALAPYMKAGVKVIIK